MKLLRRRFLRLAAGAAVSPALARAAWAQSYPARPVHLIVGFAAGGPNDTVARLIGQFLSERLGQSFVIENRTGVGGNIGTEAVVRAPADGYTLLLATGANAVNASLYDKLSFNFIRDIAPVAGLMRAPNVMVVNPSLPAKTVPEFIAYAKANAGKINMATAGNGSAPHISGELFKMMAGVDLVPVAYRGGGPALIDLLGGQMQVMFEPTISTIAYVRAGTLRALAVTSATRSELLPDIPTVGEFLPGYEASQWYGIGAPKSTPPEIVERLNRDINAGLADPKLKARLADLGGVPMPMSPAEFGKLVADETEKWGKVIRTANIKAE
ncbi:MAG TPA: tripartite tricarboxylate transporter substrate binding protein [Xanthobacteraceae bacterium]|nr:tripartite tricarboxylate transporter substrate binding protein [Xanthobacteraceae bacterium]